MTVAAHWTVVRAVISSTDTGAQVMGALPGLVRRLLDEDAWREFATPDGRTHHYEQFTEFVEALPPRGLGGRVNQLIALCGTDEELANKVRRLAMQDIAPASPHGANQHSGGHSATVSTRPDRDTAAATVARLKRDDPALADLVVSGEVTAHAAARQKGWKKPRVQLGRPETVAQRIRETFTPDQIAQLIALLLPDGLDS